MLQHHGEVELESPMNSRIEFPVSSYAPLEQQLLALQAVSTEPAQASFTDKYAAVYRFRSILSFWKGPLLSRLPLPYLLFPFPGKNRPASTAVIQLC